MLWLIFSLFVSTNFFFIQLQVGSATTFKRPIICTVNETKANISVPLCPPESCDISYTEYLCTYNKPTTKVGCKCKKNYLRNDTGHCILNDDCPPPPTCKDPNATPNKCASACQPTCEEPDPEVCTAQCIINGCECNEGYILDQTDGVCILKEDCPTCKDPNSTPNKCASACQPTCKEPVIEVCTDQCINGCECNEGYILDQTDGVCILKEDCPTCKDPNATPNICASACQPTCQKTDPGPCTRQCVVNGCECNKGYILDKDNGTCILASECPTCNDPNATPSECASACQPTCMKPNPEFCTYQCVINGCQCNKGYILDQDNGTCILISDCPNTGCNGDPNAHINECGNSCAPSCEDSEVRFCPAVCSNIPSCDCNENYKYSKKLGKCIRSCSPDCVPCPKDQQWSDCKPATCAPLSCDQVGYPVACPDYLPGMCNDKGCICKSGNVTNSKNVCVPTNQCPSCGGDKNATGGCTKSCKSGKDNYCYNYKNNVTCNLPFCDYYGCECKNGYVYDDISDKCIKPRDCPVPCKGDPHATKQQGCGSACPPTCAVPNPKVCTKQCVLNGCSCYSGYILDKKGGKCIKVNECPSDQGCNGDPNAVITSCGDPCPPTCKPSNKDCSTMGCLAVGCTCKYGYILSEEGGKCINETDCGNTNLY